MRRGTSILSLALVLSAPGLSYANKGFTKSFMTDQCGGFSNTGRNPFFILEPGYTLVLEGMEGHAFVHLVITVLDDIELVDGIAARVVEEAETHDGELVEISRNYFAICNRDNSVFYLGEDVDLYKNGVISGHEGSWRAGLGGAVGGIVMPGTLLLGARYQQEIAPHIAMDRAVIASLDAEITTPAGTFPGSLKTVESTPLEPGVTESKYYAVDVGLIRDGPVELVSYGFP